jgi:N-acetylneuraminic acid mutarotase
MTDQRELDRLLGAYFEKGTNELSDRVIDAALDQIDHTRQRSALRLPRRFPTMTMPIRIATAAVIGVLAVGGAFYLTRPDRPAVGGPSPEPSASEIASAPANPSASPSLAVIQAREPSWTPTGGMTVARTQQTATLLPDGKVLVAGGGEFRDLGIFAVASAELYDPGSGSWTATGNMAEGRESHTATLLPDGKVLVAGGNDRNDLERLSSAELYDPSSGSWTATGNMATARVYHTATLLRNGKVLVAGGSVTNDQQLEAASAELYDPTTRSWTATGSMNGSRGGHTATLLPDGKVLVAGGYHIGESLASAELYDPASGSWTATGNMAGTRAAETQATQTATLLPDGKVLVVGSTTDSGFAAELYDPGSGAWTFTGPMDGIRYLHTATLLPNGMVLVAGGGTGRSSSPLDAELYDPRTGSWAAAVNMITHPSGHTATLLLDGRVLVAGGNTDAPASASAELYDPGSGN